MKEDFIVESLDVFKFMVELFHPRTPEMEEYIHLINGLPHGCHCNRAKRINRAKELYHNLATNLSESQANLIRERNVNKKIIFKLNNQIINEI